MNKPHLEDFLTEEDVEQMGDAVKAICEFAGYFCEGHGVSNAVRRSVDSLSDDVFRCLRNIKEYQNKLDRYQDESRPPAPARKPMGKFKRVVRRKNGNIELTIAPRISDRDLIFNGLQDIIDTNLLLNLTPLTRPVDDIDD